MSDWIARELSDDKWLSFKTVKKMWRLIAQINTFSVDYQSDVLDIHESKIRPPTNLDRELESFLLSPTDRDVLHINSTFPESTAARVFFQLKSMGIRNYVALPSKRLRKYGDEMAAIVESTILNLVVVVCKHDTFIDVYRKLAPISLVAGQKTKKIIITDKTVEECEREREDNPGGNAPRPPSASQQVLGVANCLETESYKPEEETLISRRAAHEQAETHVNMTYGDDLWQVILTFVKVVYNKNPFLSDGDGTRPQYNVMMGNCEIFSETEAGLLLREYLIRITDISSEEYEEVRGLCKKITAEKQLNHGN
jgi:hypothetical protein